VAVRGDVDDCWRSEFQRSFIGTSPILAAAGPIRWGKRCFRWSSECALEALRDFNIHAIDETLKTIDQFLRSRRQPRAATSLTSHLCLQQGEAQAGFDFLEAFPSSSIWDFHGLRCSRNRSGFADQIQKPDSPDAQNYFTV
jgi:hypothetical protein